MTARPPQQKRFPSRFPLSRASGATPLNIAIAPLLTSPSSGSVETNTLARIAPTPGTLSNRSQRARRAASPAITWRNSCSTAAISCLRKERWRFALARCSSHRGC